LPLPGPRRAFTPLAGAGWTFALFLLEQICAGVTEEARPGAFTDIVSRAACVVLATSILCFLMVRVYAPEGSLRDVFGFRWPGWGTTVRLPLCALAGAALRPAMSTLDDKIVARWPVDAEAVEGMQKILTHSSRVELIVAIFVVIPIARELFFRGILYGELRRSTPALSAITSSAILFAAFTFEPREIPSALLLGLAFAVMREGAGTVLAPIAGQLGFWAVDAVPFLRGADPNADVVYPTKWLAGGVAAAVVILDGLAFRRAPEEAADDYAS